jgi:predicted transposase/invertase (TIGR01784 family)
MKQTEERYIKAEIAKFTPQEMREYETSKMAYRDIKNSVDTAKREGIAEGMEKRSLEIARKMLAKGIDEATVKEITGLSAEHILQLKAEI